MLICPKCEFENPNDNKFCQTCGTSLTHKSCFKCGAEVLLNNQFCHKCGAECGTIWIAIITKKIPVVISECGDEKLAVGSFLDRGQRYQLLELLETSAKSEVVAGSVEFKVKVLDCQPFHISPIEAMLKHQSQGLIVPSVSVIGIPNIAQTYVALQQQMLPGIPIIHDAWQQDNMQIILIKDRSHWQLLTEVWQNYTTDPAQILQWCHQMIQLWEILKPVNCCQSLLELSNLRLDENQRLSLQRLYLETPADNLTVDEEPLLTIKALGRVWRSLCIQSQSNEIDPLVEICDDLEVGKISNSEEMRSRFDKIATELKSTSELRVDHTDTKTNIKYASALTLLQNDNWQDEDKNEDAPTIILPTKLRSLEDAGWTDIGHQRDHNEDYFGIYSEQQKLELPTNLNLQARGLYILCDGMGGHAGGEVASELAVTTLRKYFEEKWVGEELPATETIEAGILLANQTIYDLNLQGLRSGTGRMGTTLAMLLMQNTKFAVAHVGDSRIYRVTTKGGLEQITVDHEVGQREIAKGLSATVAYSRPDAYQLTQALGPRDGNFVHPDISFFDIYEDTLLLLVSDGLSDNDLLEKYWQTHLSPFLTFDSNLESCLSDLIDLANQHNGHDNITAILVRVKVLPHQ